jgi:hypothetical protein
MLDVHPAHHAASSWNEFLIHITTIVLGLLVAIGLEQTVEYVHHRHLASGRARAFSWNSSRMLLSFNRMKIGYSPISRPWKRTWNCSIPPLPIRRRCKPCNTRGI